MVVRVLHVEDDPDIRAIAKIALDHEGGFELTQCPDGAAALQFAETETCDLLLLDLMIPNMSGDVLLGELRKLAGFQTVPVVFMTAKGQVDDVRALADLGALDVITKPFDPMALGARLKALLAGGA